MIDDILVLYHGNCIDGFTSAWVAQTYFQKQGDTVFIMPAYYTVESTSNVLEHIAGRKYTKIFIVDFSYKIHVLEELSKEAHEANPRVSITLLDHHKTAYEEYNLSPEHLPAHTNIYDVHIILDNNKSGALLTWDYLYMGMTPAPWLVKYVSDYDLWKFDYGDDTRYVNMVVKRLRHHQTAWSLIHRQLEDTQRRKDILFQGKALLDAHDRYCRSIANESYPVEVNGIKGLAVVCSRDFISDTGHIMAKACGTFGLLIGWDSAIGDKITLSLRGSVHCDVSAIAKVYGGGGHKGAAGFTIPISKMCEIIKGYKHARY